MNFSVLNMKSDDWIIGNIQHAGFFVCAMLNKIESYLLINWMMIMNSWIRLVERA